METHDLKTFRSKFRVEELLIMNSGSWSWSVRPEQPTLGAGILSLNREAKTLGEVSSDEMAELAGLIQALEKRLRASFSYQIMNYLMLMMVDHQVHYHVIPRYDSPRTFANLEWVDNGWPTLPLLANSQYPGSEACLQHIRAALRDQQERV